VTTVDAAYGTKTAHHRLAAFAIALTVVAALVVAGRGYRDFWISYDLLPDFKNASNFVDRGLLPEKGSLSSLGSYNPPGSSWLFVPGVWLFPRQPGLSQALGSALLFAGTIVGLVRLLGTTFSVATTVGAVAMFAFSNLGMFYASSLWARAHVLFYVWTVYFLQRWALGGRSNAGTAALAVFLLGLYWSFEIAPLVLLFPVVFVIYRPRIAPLSMVACVSVMLVVWSPYLRYEVTRSGVDVWSFLTGASGPDAHEMADSTMPVPVLDRIASAARSGILGNYMRGVRPFGGVALLVATTCGLAYATRRGRHLIERYLAPGVAPLSAEALQLHRFIALSLVAPWGLMLLLVTRESVDPSRRFWWLWLLQVYFIAFSVFWILPRLRWRRVAVLAVQASLVLAILPLVDFKAAVAEVRRSGYAGSGERLAVVDTVAAILEAQPKTAAKIGYELAVPVWQRDKTGRFIFKVGDDYDIVLWRRHHIDNLDNADIGFSPDDEFRIVELVSTDALREIPLHSNDLTQFTEVAHYPHYWVGRRTHAVPDR